MANKNLLEIFSKYQPNNEIRDILLNASDHHVRIDQDKRLVEIECRFPFVVKQRTLHLITEEIKSVYQLHEVSFRPHFPPACFSLDCIDDLLMETEERGVLARGFFAGYQASLFNNRLDIHIPMVNSGIVLMENAKTPDLIQNIVKDEFGIDIKVQIIHDESISAIYEETLSQKINTMDTEIKSIYEGYGSESRSLEGSEVQDESVYKRVSSVFNPSAKAMIENGICTIGPWKFKIDSPEYVIGSSFNIDSVMSISSVDQPVHNLVIIGVVSSFLAEPTKSGDKYNISFGLFDGNASISVKKNYVDLDSMISIKETIADGAVVALHGYVKREVHKDKPDKDLSFFFNDVATIEKIERKDNADEKRVELHLHTTMSTMDALTPPEVIVRTAHKWGHKAIAITDHANVQAFPLAMLEAEKLGGNIKIIYGMEAYFVNNTSKALNGEYTGHFTDEMILFDLETTGLTPGNCKIIEIGAVKIKNLQVVDHFDSFVNPGIAIPEEITKLTSITDDMVKDAPTIAEILPIFVQFIGDASCMMIAHNADFDMGFLRYDAQKLGIEWNHPYLDTVSLSRYLNPQIKNHKLDTLSAYYHLDDFHHHRACDDAEILGLIYFEMVKQLQDKGISNFNDLLTNMTDTDPLKLKTFHQILLVKDKIGLKNLYKLISFSYLDYYHRFPRIPKTILEKYREGLLVGSACESGELYTAILENKPQSDIDEIVEFYDYLEIQPLSNNHFLIEEGRVADEEALKNINRKIVELGEKHHKLVVATCDVHFLNEEDEIGRKILLSGMKFSDAEKDVHLYLRTTEEMLNEFSYLGKEKAYEVVVTNTNLISDMIEKIRPIPKGSFTPHMDGAEEELQNLCWTKAKAMYGDPVPEIVAKRLQKELDSIISHGFAVLYMIAQRLVHYSESQGYLVGSRGSVGSSFVATMAGISEVNPLPPHYYCPDCKIQEFFLNGEVGSGFDLPDKNCPKCGKKYLADGHNIPFETFLGFYGDKSPDIDLNFSGEVQGRVHKYTEELFGTGNVFRAGTLGTLADKTAYGFIAKYLEGHGISVCRAEMDRLVNVCVGVKRTTGQHPGGIIVVPREYDVYDFTPVQHPADDPKSDIITTHFSFVYLHDTILKLDELGHDVPTKYKMIERFSNTSVMDVPMNDPDVYELFLSTKTIGASPSELGYNLGTLGLPEFGTDFAMRMLEDAKPKSFADLLQISGLSHGTDVWTGNAQDLIKNGICTISEVIGCRDNIMNDLIRFGVENSLSFKIMESVRKGKGLKPEWEDAIKASSAPDWYIPSCKKIKYMFPKAHAAAYVISAIRLGWYKVHMPVVFYAAILTVAPGGFDAEIVGKGINAVRKAMDDIKAKNRNDQTQKDKQTYSSMEMALECMVRGIKFLPVDIEKSDAHAFLPENNNMRMPFSALPGLGENAAENIMNARLESSFFSIEDLQIRAKLTKSVIEILKKNHVLDHINETNQLTFF